MRVWYAARVLSTRLGTTMLVCLKSVSEDLSSLILSPLTLYLQALNEDLGRVEYVFSDKTGTLTANDMVLKKFVQLGCQIRSLVPKCLLAKPKPSLCLRRALPLRCLLLRSLSHTSLTNVAQASQEAKIKDQRILEV